MNKILVLLVVAWCGAFSAVRADDVAEARKAFDLFVQYQKTDDERMMDLFAADISVTLTFDTGKETRDMVLPPEAFRELVSAAQARDRTAHECFVNLVNIEPLADPAQHLDR